MAGATSNETISHPTAQAANRIQYLEALNLAPYRIKADYLRPCWRYYLDAAQLEQTIAED